jgi:hypothetical protein
MNKITNILILLLMWLTGCSDNKKYIKTAYYFCSCYGGVKFLLKHSNGFDVICEDNMSYMKNMPLDAEYAGKICNSHKE